MGDFLTFALAEARVYAKIADGTWINGHAPRATTGGKIVVRVQRKMSAAAPDNGAWVEIDQDNQT